MRVAFFIVLLLASGCVTQATVTVELRQLESTLSENHERLRSCAPVELGKAEAVIAFSRHDSWRGNSLAASSFLAEARSLVAVAMSKSQGTACEGDRDGDGIADTVDRCPDIPEDFDGEADKDGCPDFDRDLDGVADDRDKCPNDKEDKDGFQDADGCPEFDNDRDGLLDTSDQCPNEPEDFDRFQDLDGCPDHDNDGDDIVDSKDKCPNIPGPKESQGCADAYKYILVSQERISLKQQIEFKPGKAKLSPKSYAILNEIAKVLRGMPSVALRIEAHTDSAGAASDNQRLSQAQANEVRKYLIKRGLSGKRLAALGHGEDRPLDDNDTPEGRLANRRVEFYIIR